MIRDIIEVNESIEPNEKEICVLKQVFPACFHENGSFDIDRFKEYLRDKVSIQQEGYELRFLGKNYAKMLSALETETVIVPDEEHNSKPENSNSKNVYISGDNLDGLKHLLKSYAGEVKCIYIDPPYNTGSDDFSYKDNFSFSVEELMEKLSVDEAHAKRILDLTSRGSASHKDDLIYWYRRGGLKVISLVYNFSLRKRIVRHELIERIGLKRDIYWGFFPLSDEEFVSIVKQGQSMEYLR